MDQQDYPLAYAKLCPPEAKQENRLPLRWKAVFVLLILYSASLSLLTFSHATEANTEVAATTNTTTSQINQDKLNPRVSSTNSEQAPAQAGAQVTVTASVNGWYEVKEIDSKSLSIMSNMKIWVNGREFVRCNDCDQEKLDPAILDF